MNTEEENVSIKKGNFTIKNIVTDGVIVGFITVIGYLCAGTYEASYAKYYGIPVELIELKVTKIIQICFLVFVNFIGVYTYFTFFSNKNESNAKKIIKIEILYLIMLIPTFGYSYGIYNWVYWLDRSLSFIMFVLAAHFIFFMYILYIKTKIRLIFRKRKGLETEKEDINNYEKIKNTLSVMWVVLISIFFVILISSTLGEGTGMRKINYLVLKDKPDYIVLAIYGNNVVCGDYDTNTKIIGQNRIVFKIGENIEKHFIIKSVGPIKSLDKKSSYNDILESIKDKYLLKSTLFNK